MEKEKSKVKEQTVPEFTKEQILQASRFSKHIDIIDALLQADKRYTMEQVNDIVDGFLKGKVE